MKKAVTIRPLSRELASDITALQKVLESAPSYWMRICARLPEPDAAVQTFNALPPPGKTHSCSDHSYYNDKFVLGIFDETGLMMGCADVIRFFPDAKTAMLGLLLISETKQKQGYGKLAYKAIERLALSWPGIVKLRIGVIEINDVVLPFWKSLGFVETGVKRPYQDNGVISQTIVLEKKPLKSFSEY